MSGVARGFSTAHFIGGTIGTNKRASTHRQFWHTSEAFMELLLEVHGQLKLGL